MEEDINISYNSNDAANLFSLEHDTIVRWIKQGLKIHSLSDSFVKQIGANNKVYYVIDEAGFDYLCNRYKGVKPITMEFKFKEALIPFLEIMGYTVEYQKTILKYRVDFYVRELNLVIEHDEEYHNRTMVSRYDIKREADITRATGCLFLRIPAKLSIYEALGCIAYFIMQNCLETKNTASKGDPNEKES